MRELDRDGRILCEMQGKIFEESAEKYGTSSAVFVRRYMNSDYAARMDRPGFLDRPTDVEEAFDSLDEQYGKSRYGSEHYSGDELYWIGYIYRYWTYVYGITSKAAYRISNAANMHAVYYAYHTMDPLAAIQRIREAKGADPEGGVDMAYAVKLLRRIRAENGGFEPFIPAV